MRHFIIFLFSTVIILSCSKETVLPVCIEEQINLEEASDPVDKVFRQKVEGKEIYWLQTGAQAYDGVEYILTESCDTVCYLCGNCPFNQCDTLYRNDLWNEIWVR